MNKPNSSLSQFIEEYPLYMKFGIDQPAEIADLNNLVFNFFCREEKEIQPFRINANSAGQLLASHNGTATEMGKTIFTEIFTGVCQSCENYKIKVVINSGSQKDAPRYFLRKIGQYPPPESMVARLPEEINFFVGDESRLYYVKALMNLEMECGSGSLAYFQRVLRIEMNRLVETIANPYSHASHEVMAAYSNYVADGVKTRFIEKVTAFLPKSLQDYGGNIIAVLHEAMSLDVSALSETECLRKSKDIDALFRYMAKRILAEINDPFSDRNPDKYFLRYS